MFVYKCVCACELCDVVSFYCLILSVCDMLLGDTRILKLFCACACVRVCVCERLCVFVFKFFYLLILSNMFVLYSVWHAVR